MYLCHAEMILINDNADREEEKECQPDFALLLGPPSGGGVANAETQASATHPDNGEGKTQTKVGFDKNHKLYALGILCFQMPYYSSLLYLQSGSYGVNATRCTHNTDVTYSVVVALFFWCHVFDPVQCRATPR